MNVQRWKKAEKNREGVKKKPCMVFSCFRKFSVSLNTARSSGEVVRRTLKSEAGINSLNHPLVEIIGRGW